MSSNRSFGLVFFALFTFLAVKPLFSNGQLRVWPLPIALVFLVLALVAPKLLYQPNKLWTRFGLLLQKITHPIVMAVLFFGIVTPFGICMRLFGKDLLRLRIDKSTKSYWINKEHRGPASESMKQPF
jgi:hypothetical protein